MLKTTGNKRTPSQKKKLWEAYFKYILRMLHLYFRSLNSGNCSSNFDVCYMVEKTQSYNLDILYNFLFLFIFFASLLCYWNSIAVYIVFSNKNYEVSTFHICSFLNYLCINNIHITLKVVYTNADLKIWYYFHR